MMGENRQVFTDIYTKRIWGRKSGWKFYSGSGSHLRKIIGPYVDYLKKFIRINHIHSVCDIGCGDFHVMQEVMKYFPDIEYFGIDVVEELIKWNNERFKQVEKWNFICADATKEDEIPAAELLLIRQVLQHLDNTSIQNVLKRLGNYKYAIITEHITPEEVATFNIDKPTDDSVRAASGSGVYIDREPFDIKHVAHVLVYEGRDGTQIRTSLVSIK